MKAIRIHNYNTAPTLEDAPTPQMGDNQVLIRVKAASINPLDFKIQRGEMHAVFPLAFPYTLGTDAAGFIEKVGRNVREWKPGDAVVVCFAPTVGGAFAEYAVAGEHEIVRAPQTISLEEAAGIPIAAGTAWQALFESGAWKQGQTILIHAGAGGVGSFAVQFAHQAGARVIATASGANVNTVYKLGADQVIDYKTDDFSKKLSDIDLVIDTIGGDTQRRSYSVLKKRGTLLATSEYPDEAVAQAHDVSASFVFFRPTSELLQKAIDYIDQKHLRVLTDSKVTLARFSEGFEQQISGRAHGKILVQI